MVHGSFFLSTCAPADPAHRHRGAQGVNADIHRAAYAVVGSGLMPFVGGCIEHTDSQAACGITGFPYVQRLMSRGVQSAVSEKKQDAVFGEMPYFTNHQLNRSDACIGDVRNKKAQERADQSGRLLTREMVR